MKKDTDLTMESGINLYSYFRRTEKKFYKVSDYIGCMSQKNSEFLLKHNPEILYSSVEICPNSIEPIQVEKNEKEIIKIRKEI